MGTWELFHYSLQSKVFRSTIMGAIVIGLATMLVGLSLYTISLVNQYIAESFGLAKNAAVIIEHWINEDDLSNEVMRIYRSLSEDERQRTGTEEYKAAFAHVKEMDTFRCLKAILNDSRSASDVDDIYLAYYDHDSQALVYICDPDDSLETGFEPGEWEKVDIREINKFYSWDGNGRLYDISSEEKYGWMCTSGVPLTNNEGTITGFILADITLKNVMESVTSFLIQYIVVLLITVMVVAWFMTRRMKKTLVKPINDIAEAAKDYVADRKNGVVTPGHFSGLNIHTGDEIENLGLVMADMEKDLTDYETFLTQITAEKERITTELALATRIQADMLPNTFPAFPDRKEFDIYASMDPAKEVGGDFYDFFKLDEDHLALVIADVSGKGIPAALFMMVSKTLIRSEVMTGCDPATALQRVNSQLCEHNVSKMFVTVWLAIIDLSTGKGISANAGHEHPCLRRADGTFELDRYPHDLVLGIIEITEFRNHPIELNPGDCVFVYTDGVPEAEKTDRDMFGLDRLLETLNQNPDASPEELIQRVHGAVDEFAGDAEQFDDITMLCLEYLGRNQEDGRQVPES